MNEGMPKSTRRTEAFERLSGLDHPVASFQLSVAMSHRAYTEGKEESLSDAFCHLLEECRMVLPGIQALFGFQLIAVFSQAFWSRVPPAEQILHFTSIGLVTLSIALVMTPAAYHRRAEPAGISSRIVTLSRRLLFWSMVPLLAAFSCEFYIIGALVLGSRWASLAVTLPLTGVFCALWFALPRLRRMRDMLGGTAGAPGRAARSGWKITKGV